MARAAKKVSEADQREWAAYARTVRPLEGRALPEALPAPTIPEPIQHPDHLVTPRKPPPINTALSVGNQPGGLDNSSWNRFRSGKLAAVRTLDLHGRTAQRAFHALHSFLHAAHADHVRCVEVITGRGAGETGGVIRREFPLWLNLPALRPLVLAASHPHAANPGSVRLLLRRPK
ncbi:MAG: Smr/MutS family protein [Alphaproteobacteria bacterium]|nr:Smr/MutS family protein [Alphaproteobacteria bacterium]